MDTRITRGQAIRAKCLDCCCGQHGEVRRCTAMNCPLWRFRLGREIKGENPSNELENKGNDSEGQRYHPAPKKAETGR